MTKQAESTNPHSKLVKKLLFTTVCMFGFGFAMVPLYDVFCDITGLNGKTSDQAAAVSDRVDTSRLVKVEFVTRTQGSLPWQFQPAIKFMRVHPGQMHQVNFNVTNHSANNMVVQAVPSVSPGMAAAYFNKIECFCFNHQPLEQGQTAALGLQFYVDKELPAEYSTVTLSYTLFDITENVEEDEINKLFANNEKDAQERGQTYE